METSAPILLSLHDLYQYITLSRFIDIIIEDPEVFYDYSRSYGESDTMKNLNGIFDSFENGGITQVELDFGHLLDFNGNKVTRAQTGLMGHSRRNGPSAINMKDILPENYIPSEEECIYGR